MKIREFQKALDKLVESSDELIIWNSISLAKELNKIMKGNTSIMPCQVFSLLKSQKRIMVFKKSWNGKIHYLLLRPRGSNVSY